MTLGKIREDPLFPTFRALRSLRGLKFPCHFWTAGIKTFTLVYLVERPFSEGVRTLKVTEVSKCRTFLS